MKNKFFTNSDKQIDALIYPLKPKFWWSRRFEYPFAMDFINPTDVVLDACCGLEHPLKFALVDKCKEINAIDLSDISYDNINVNTKSRFGFELDESIYNKIKFKQGDITKLPYKNGYFNKIVCISALEHMSEGDIITSLKEFKRTLKKDGQIILTMDYPTLDVEKLMEIIKEVGLIIDGEFDYNMDGDLIGTEYFGYGLLNCYSIVLKK